MQMAGQMAQTKKCRGVCWQNDLGGQMRLPLSERIITSPKIAFLRCNAMVECEPSPEMAGFMWKRLEAVATEAGISFRALEGSILVNAGCGRVDLASSIGFAYAHGASTCILNDILLPPAERIGAIMAQVPSETKSKMGIIFAEGDMAELFGMLGGRLNVTMGLITGPEIVTGAVNPLDYQRYMQGIAATLTSIIPPGGMFFGHSSAPFMYVGGNWGLKAAGGMFFCTRK
jgi:hypothetical protein